MLHLGRGCSGSAISVKIMLYSMNLTEIALLCDHIMNIVEGSNGEEINVLQSLSRMLKAEIGGRAPLRQKMDFLFTGHEAAIFSRQLPGSCHAVAMPDLALPLQPQRV